MSYDEQQQRPWFSRLIHAFMREPSDRNELIDILREARENELLDSEALAMIEGVLSVSLMKVRDIMIPRTQMIVIEANATPNEAIPQIIKSAHSRFPVIGDNRDEIIGILLAKDLLQFTQNENIHSVKMRDLVRPAFFVPESKRLDILLKEFRLKRNHMAIVIDEYGAFDGLVTIEDVLEQIVGEISDEYDPAKEEVFIKPINEYEFSVKALTPIEEFNRYFGTELDDSEVDTIGGLVLAAFSHLPKPGEYVTLDGFEIKIIHATARGIHLLRVMRVTSKE